MGWLFMGTHNDTYVQFFLCVKGELLNACSWLSCRKEASFHMTIQKNGDAADLNFAIYSKI